MSNYLVPASASGAIGTINQAQFYYVADPVSVTFGTAVPTLHGHVDGIVSTDTLAAVVSGNVLFSTTATSASGAGLYPITGSGFTVKSLNYFSNILQRDENNHAYTIVFGPSDNPAITSSVTQAQRLGQNLLPSSETEVASLSDYLEKYVGVEGGKAIIRNTFNTLDVVGLDEITKSSITITDLKYGLLQEGILRKVESAYGPDGRLVVSDVINLVKLLRGDTTAALDIVDENVKAVGRAIVLMLNVSEGGVADQLGKYQVNLLKAYASVQKNFNSSTDEDQKLGYKAEMQQIVSEINNTSDKMRSVINPDVKTGLLDLFQ
ncbi:MAG: hypothetical protein HQL37_15560 [Alphaproteobacteria bacterium]|nr:hypothetical protein [Alphaproteobacteria bacterium]